MAKRSLVALACAALLVAVSAVPAAANHKWSRYHWARSATTDTIQLVFSEGSGTSDWAASAVRGDWNAFSPLNSNSTRTLAVSTGNSGVDVTVAAANYGANGWVGLAQIGLEAKSHIVSGQIKLNTYYAITAAQRRSTYCMEVGHIFGLGHNNEGKRGGLPDDTCMNENRWEVSPNSHDRDQLAQIYNHADGYSTYLRPVKAIKRVTIHVAPAPAPSH